MEENHVRAEPRGEATVDPRVQRTRHQVLAAGAELLRDHGPQGVTQEDVAKHAGVGRATVYRHWPERRQLLLDIIKASGEEPTVDLTGDLRRDLLALLLAIADKLEHSPMQWVLTALVERAQREPDAGDVLRQLVAHGQQQLLGILRAAVNRGELPRSLDEDHAVAALAGPLFFRQLVARRPTPPELITALVDAYLAGVLAGAPADTGTQPAS